MSGGSGSGGDDIPDTGTDGHVLTKDSGTELGYAWAAAPGAGGGAATTSAFVTIGNDASLSAERALTDDGATVQHTDGGAGTTVTTSVRDNGITFAKMQDIATDRLIGRDTAASGDPEALTVGGGIEFTGTGGIQRSALTGDVTASAGSAATTIANNAVTTAKIADAQVTLAKQANLAQDTLIGRQTASTGVPEAIACTAAGRALIDDADAAAQRTTLGLGTLATQSGTFSGTSSGTNTGDQTNITGNAATVTTNANLTGPVTSVGNATAITDAAVTLAKMANLAQDQFIGRTTASTGVPETATITAAARTVLDDTTVGAMRTTLGLAIGTDVQAQDAELAAIAGLTSAADSAPYFTGSGTAALMTVTTAARTVLDDTTVAAMLTTLGGLGGALGATDNQLLRSDGTGTKTAQGTTITVDDANGIAGHTEVQNVQSGTTYTMAASDCGKVVIFTSASAVTVTVPQTLTVGWHCRWEQQGAGKVSFNGTAVTAATLRNRQSQVASAGQYAVGGLACYTSGTPAVVTLFGDTGA